MDARCLSREMLALARAGAANLEPEVAAAIRAFVLSRRVPGGMVMGRGGMPDIYYTLFAQSCLAALGSTGAPRAMETGGRWPAAVAAAEGFVGAASAIRLLAWAAAVGGDCALAGVSGRIPGGTASPEAAAARVGAETERLLGRLADYRTPDGGYHELPGVRHGSVYACFLALLAHQDAGRPLPDPAGVMRCLDALRAVGGGYGNEPGQPVGQTNATAAALLLGAACGRPLPAATACWLRAQHRPGSGFAATPRAPAADLLSTATALFALRLAGGDLGPIRADCWAFAESLWDDGGGFRGFAGDGRADVEYTFYALLTFGS